MSIFSTSQNRHLYVAKRFADGSTIHYPNDLTISGTASQNPAVGDIAVKKTADGKMQFLYKGPAGVMSSDRIDIKNISYIKAFRAKDLVTPLKSYEVTLKSGINSGAPIGGQDYVLRILIKGAFALGHASEYLKDAAVHATAGMTASNFYKEMVKALNASFSREVGATKDSNPYFTFAVDNNSTATKLIITEKIQDWRRGMQNQNDILFDVQPTTVYTGGEDVIWGDVTNVTPTLKVVDTNSSNPTYGQLIDNASISVGTNAKGNGENLADLEWFCMGERGDQVRGATWPDDIQTKYMIDESLQYNILEIHHAFTDTGVNSYRSEKDITIAVPVGTVGNEYTVINALIGAINTATGLSVATLS